VTKQLTQIKDDQLFLNFHPGQIKAWDSKKRFTFVLAGTQSGKTEFGVHWLFREIQKCGDGDYMVVSPSFPLQQKKVVPTYENVLKTQLKLGEYKAGARIFELRNRGFCSNVFFGSADNPDSLESCTAKAAHLDEVGQKGFRLSSWEAILRRLSINEGRALGTTTIYNLGWMKSQIYDKWKNNEDEDIEVIQFSSIMNPAFPRKEYDRAQRTLPAWKFNMFYKGLYDRPAGMIYDCFNDIVCKIKPFALNPTWKRHVGLDFGGVNTVALWYAEHKVNSETTNYYLYREYKSGGRSAKEHAKEWLRLSEGENVENWVGGSHSEGQWRLEFQQAGIPVKEPPVKDVEVGIDRVYGLHKRNGIYAFDTCQHYLDQKTSYSRVLDDMGNPTEKIEDKEKYHYMDAERYIVVFLVGNVEAAMYGVDPEPDQRMRLFR